jgi:hypothetical protein
MTHYNLDNIDKIDANINIIYGERSNGKSYQVKHKKAVEKYLKTGKRFILMRRWKEEITSEKIEQYFADVDVMKITDNNYNCISMYKKQLFLSNYNNETGKTVRGEKIGYVVALSTEQNYAGASYLDVEDIIFEEFMSRSVYIAGESDKLMNFRSTVDRKRNIVKLWLVGNSISRVCPYINDWDLHKIITNQKQGTIEVTELPTGDIDIENGKEITLRCAIEFCASTGVSSFAIGKHKDMLNKGSWQSDPQPHLPKSYKDYKMLYRIMFQYQSFKFIGEYLLDKINKDVCWFVYPYNRDINNKTIVFSDVVKTSSYWQRDIYNPNIKNEKIKSLLQTFRESQIFYSTDLCGTDFKQVIDFTIRK